jgi:hypothetical protein
VSSVGEIVFPLVDEGGEPSRFCGSAFFVATTSRPILATAAHVVAGSSKLVIVTPPATRRDRGSLDPRGAGDVWPCEILAVDVPNDLAILNVEGYEPPLPMRLRSTFNDSSEQLCCIDLARTSDDASDVVQSTRFGNLVRFVNDNRFPQDSIELSFAALRGASGAPVFYRLVDEFVACGVIKGNAAYELLPVEIYRVEDKVDGTAIVETTKYCLPQGIAVHAKHLAKLISRVATALER